MEDIYVRHKIPYEVVRAYVDFLRHRKALMPVLGVNRLLNTQALRKMGIK